MADSTETNGKRYLRLDAETWKEIQSLSGDSKCSISINDITYELSRPIKGESGFYSIQEQLWAHYDLLETFVIVPHNVATLDAVSAFQDFIVPIEWVNPEDWKVEEES